ncbi:rhomboid family intramembrane serine protease [Zunongwangia sp.]|uniref:rhomboid family intramembrane serine protease n=1 Tax=Zunongwangia sp. TaxID=1965325 RepID=UPI003AA88D6C
MNTSDRLRYKLNTASVTEKLIAVNVAVFLLFYIFRTVAYLFNLAPDFLMEWFVFPSNPSEFIIKPWSIVTYSFLHGGIWHILSNMLILYFSGIYFLNYFSPRRLLNYYFLGVICGALIYMLSYNLFPAFSQIGKSYLIGASAGVMAVLIGIATQIPNMRVRLFLFGSVKFWIIAVILVAIDVIQIPSGNAGGHLAHLGGAALGYVYTKQLQKGNDIGAWWEQLMDTISDLFKKKKNKSNMKTVYKNQKKSNNTKSNKRSSGKSKSEEQQKVDVILDKISKSGYDSLTKAEKDFLFRAGKDN